MMILLQQNKKGESRGMKNVTLKTVMSVIMNCWIVYELLWIVYYESMKRKLI
jgi:hypothetical protein